MNHDGGKNLVVDPQFSKHEESWRFESPCPALEPKHRVSRSDEKNVRLRIEANGDPRAFGWWRGSVNMKNPGWYRARISAHVDGVESPELSVFAHVGDHYLAPQRIDVGLLELEQEFRIDRIDGPVPITFYLRSAASGSVEFEKPVVVEIPAPAHRRARLATIRFDSDTMMASVDAQRTRIERLVREAGALKPDVITLTEMTTIVGVDKKVYGGYRAAAEPVPEGPTFRMLSDLARSIGSYIIAGLIEQRGAYAYNTGVVIGRDGKLVGQYDKTHLTFGELTAGLSCGDEYPVFDLDFGRIAVHICYDEWFPEVARLYAHKNAEVLFLLVMGGKPITWRTRALDNGIYFVSSSAGPPSMVIDSSGAIIAETHGEGVAYSDVDLEYRKTNVYIDPTLTHGMPTIVPHLRYVADNSLLDENREAMGRYRGTAINGYNRQNQNAESHQ